MNRFFVLSGCSGGGKTTLIRALAGAGAEAGAAVATVDEPGRRLVAASLAGDGEGLPWKDLAGFARRAIDLAITDREAATRLTGPVVFDRGLIDAVAAYEHATGTLPPEADLLAGCYAPEVFLAPPWPEIYATDPERRHGWDEAVAEYHRLVAFLPRFGYRAIDLPRGSLDARVAFLRARLGAG